MSRVRRLSIMGIRNFGDDREETIKFTRPLTLIIGENGVGKTTVIEALRYASTGEFPPGSDRGKGFIHDPILKQSHANVRGKVKAEFVDKSGRATTVTRVIEATRGEKIVFKTVDSTISTVDKKTLKEYTITHRCADVDKEMKACLGLSTAILNNVIFCHQDDSNWPMDDNKKLKERLDEIFDTTRYNKALDQLRKIIKQKQTDIRNLNIEINSLKLIVSEVSAKEMKLKECQSRRIESTMNIDEISKKLEPVKKKITDITKTEQRMAQLNVEKQKKQYELSMAQDQLKSLRSSIKEIFSGSDAELAAQLKSFDDNLGDKKDGVRAIKSQLEKLFEQEDKTTNVLSDLRIRIGTFKQQLKDEQRKTEERNKILNLVLEESGLDQIDSETSEGFIPSSIYDVELKLQEREEALNEIQGKYEQEENELNKKVEGCKNDRMKIDVELKRCEREYADAKTSLRDIRAKIAAASEAEKKLNAVDKKLEEANKLIGQLSDEIASNDYQTKIQEKIKVLEEIEDDCNKTDELAMILQNENALKAQFGTLESELSRKHGEIEDLKRKHGKQLEELLGTNGIPKSGLKMTVGKLQAALTERLNKLRRDINQEQNKATSLETTIAHAKQELRTKMADVEIDKKKIAELCGDYTKYDSTLSAVSSKLKTCQNRRGMYAYQGAAYNEYLKKLSEPKPCCPLCDRDFVEDSEASRVITKLNDDLKNHPERLQKCEEELSRVKSKHESLLAMKTTVEKIIKFEEVDKGRMTKGIKDNEVKLVGLKKNIESVQSVVSDVEKKITICNNLSGSLAVWDQCLSDIERLEQDYEQIQEKVAILASQHDDKSLEDVNNEREVLKQRRKQVQDEIASFRKKMDLQNEEIKRAKDSKARILEEQLRIHNEVQKVKQWRENVTEITKKEGDLRITIQSLKQQLITADEKLETELQLLEDMKNQHREELDKSRKKLMEYSKQVDKLNELQTEVVALQSRKIESLLKKVQADMEMNEETLADIKKKSIALKEQLDELNEDMASYEVKKRNLNDNLEYRKCKASIGEIQEVCEKIAEEIEGLDIEQLKKECEFLKRKAEKLEKEIHIESGKDKELSYQITQLEDELQREEYCTARNRYNIKRIELKITQEAITDIAEYCKAVDAAMTKYHEERMESVNKSMKNLWNLIYTGTDTSSIKIKTEATGGKADRRQFNYRLVQVKHGVEMDMRGRCSAGQRVLASIVIRLALAETFCEQCGMLALDEPTTNLDAGNAANLAETLYNYVKIRAAYQKAFQLIVITHDQQFIHKLTQLNNTGGFYELYRNDRGLTSVAYLTTMSTVDDPQYQRRRRNEIEQSDDDDDNGDNVDGVTEADSSNKKNSGNAKPSTSKKRMISPTATTSKTKKPYNFQFQ